MPVDNSRLKSFYKLTVEERRKAIADLAKLNDEQVAALAASGELDETAADRMIENVIGTMSLPVGVATNFIIDGKHYVVPLKASRKILMLPLWQPAACLIRYTVSVAVLIMKPGTRSF